MKHKFKYFHFSNTPKHRLFIWIGLAFAILIIMANLGAIIDSILHPEIEYFDSEHLIVGGATTLVVGTAFVLLIIYIIRLEKAIFAKKLKEEALELSEEKHRLLIENSHDIIYTLSADGHFIFVSNSWTLHLGHNVANITGHHFSNFIHIDDLPKCIQWFNKVINSGQRQKGIEYRVQHLDGTWYWHTSSAVPLKDEAGTVIGLEGIATDITNRKILDEELLKYRDHLEETVRIRTEKLNIAYQELTKQIEKEKDYQLRLQKSLEKEIELSKMKSNLISTVSHEFRTPLSSILSSTELLHRFSDKWEPNKKFEHMDRISRKIDYLTNLLDDILLIGDSESGNFKVNSKRINLKSLLNDCVNDSILASNELHEFIFNYSCQQEFFILDENILHIALSNLLSNALKFSANGGTIFIDADFINNSIVINVRDQGLGIPPSEIDLIFHSFNRASNVKSISGNGLGLSIVKNTMDLLGAEIKVSSILNEGTNFTIIIPLIE